MERDPLRSSGRVASSALYSIHETADDIAYYNSTAESEEPNGPETIQTMPGTSTSTSTSLNEQTDSISDRDSVFECNVCMEPVQNRDPVVTQCGHLYCWPCIFRWLSTNHTTCPVCKAGVSKG